MKRYSFEMYPTFTLALPLPLRPMPVGEPIFIVERNGWFMRAGVLTTGGPPAPDVHVQYRMPNDVEAMFDSNAAQSYRSSVTVGIEESVPCSLVVPMDRLGQPPIGGSPLLAGTIVVLLRPEPFRVQLAQLESSIAPGDAGLASMRLLAPNSTGSSIAAVGASMKAKPGTFVAVAAFASRLQGSFDPVEPRVFLA